MTTPDYEQVVAQQVLAATEARDRAHATWQQTVRDAKAQGVDQAQITRLLGTESSAAIEAVPAERNPPAGKALLPPAVFLRGARVPEADWDTMKEAMWARGWHTIVQRTEAWHLARGRLPVVLVDFSTRDPDEIRVGLITAKHGDDGALQLRTPYAQVVPTPRSETGERDAEAIAILAANTLGTVAAIKSAARAGHTRDSSDR